MKHIRVRPLNTTDLRGYVCDENVAATKRAVMTRHGAAVPEHGDFVTCDEYGPCDVIPREEFERAYEIVVEKKRGRKPKSEQAPQPADARQLSVEGYLANGEEKAEEKEKPEYDGGAGGLDVSEPVEPPVQESKKKRR